MDESSRLREEDPYTDRIAKRFDSRVLVSRSRFEVDLNRPREHAIYRTPAESWDLEVWRAPVPDDLIQRSLAVYDDFYADLAERLDQLADNGPFLVLDVHSFNHRRGPEQAAAPQAENPDVNVGTGSMSERWRPFLDAFIEVLGGREVQGRPLDVRENVRFKGAQLARWVHQRYPDRGCALALEFKKTFMDEWTGAVDFEHLGALADALEAVVLQVLPSFEAVRA